MKQPRVYMIQKKKKNKMQKGTLPPFSIPTTHIPHTILKQSRESLDSVKLYLRYCNFSIQNYTYFPY